MFAVAKTKRRTVKGECRGRRLVLVELAGRDWHESEVKKQRREEGWNGERREEERSERERKAERG